MKVINFFGAPGVGKTTKALGLTERLKIAGVDVEISLEIAKDFILEKNERGLIDQMYIVSHHEKKQRICLDSKEVEMLVTDAPLLHCAYYAPENFAAGFKDLVIEMFNCYDNLNFFVNRNHQYTNQARVHNEDRSIIVNQKMKSFLINNNIPHIDINSTDELNDSVIPYILEKHRVKGYLESKITRN